MTDHERQLAEIWASVLDIDASRILPRDNFFDLGGHSLLAMRAVESAGRAFGFRIDPRRYFYETLAQLANPAAAQQSATNAPKKSADAPGGFLKRLFGARGDKGRP